MFHKPLGNVVCYLRRLTRGEGETALSDGKLVERFVATHEEDAFAELMGRHGAMVLGVAKRVLGDVHRAEDVFQATFLVLARKAGSIRRKDAIAGWLAQVAYHLALRSRAAVARREAAELAAATADLGITMTTELDRSERNRVLDEELHRMGEKFHVPLVLCYLEGKTYEEAARQLNWPLGTVKKRLSQARELLRKRLLRRGVALGAAGAAMAELTRDVSAAQVAPELLRSVLRSALVFAAGKSVEAGFAATLAEGMLHGMAVAKWKFTAGLFLALLVAGAAGTLVYSRVAEPVPAAAQQPSGDEHPAPKAEAAVPAPEQDRSVNGLRLDLDADRTKTSLRPDGQGAEAVTFTLSLTNVSNETLRRLVDMKTSIPGSLTLVVTDAKGKKVGMFSQTVGEQKQMIALQLRPSERLVITRFALPGYGVVFKEPGLYSIRVTLAEDKSPRINSNEFVLTVLPAAVGIARPQHRPASNK